MVQRRKRLRFAREPRQAVRIEREDLWQHFDRDVAIQFRIAGAIDLAHSPGADLRGDFVDADSEARGEGHGHFFADMSVDRYSGKLKMKTMRSCLTPV